MEIKNNGTTAIFYEWRKVPVIGKFEALRPNTIQKFYFSTVQGERSYLFLTKLKDALLCLTSAKTDSVAVDVVVARPFSWNGGLVGDHRAQAIAKSLDRRSYKERDAEETAV